MSYTRQFTKIETADELNSVFKGKEIVDFEIVFAGYEHRTYIPQMIIEDKETGDLYCYSIDLAMTYQNLISEL
jgi:hypothetical protein